MKEIAVFKTDYASNKLIATVFLKKGGLIIGITGPNDHLGGIGLGIPYVRENGENSANYNIFSFLGHRDGELAGKVAQNIAKITRYNTVVILGIHIPDLSAQELNRLTSFFEEWSIKIGEKLVNEIFLDLDKLK